jgi:hypothetical protein
VGKVSASTIGARIRNTEIKTFSSDHLRRVSSRPMPIPLFICFASETLHPIAFRTITSPQLNVLNSMNTFHSTFDCFLVPSAERQRQKEREME